MSTPSSDPFSELIASIERIRRVNMVLDDNIDRFLSYIINSARAAPTHITDFEETLMDYETALLTNDEDAQQAYEMSIPPRRQYIAWNAATETPDKGKAIDLEDEPEDGLKLQRLLEVTERLKSSIEPGNSVNGYIDKLLRRYQETPAALNEVLNQLERMEIVRKELLKGLGTSRKDGVKKTKGSKQSSKVRKSRKRGKRLNIRIDNLLQIVEIVTVPDSAAESAATPHTSTTSSHPITRLYERLFLGMQALWEEADGISAWPLHQIIARLDNLRQFIITIGSSSSSMTRDASYNRLAYLVETLLAAVSVVLKHLKRSEYDPEGEDEFESGDAEPKHMDVLYLLRRWDSSAGSFFQGLSLRPEVHEGFDLARSAWNAVLHVILQGVNVRSEMAKLAGKERREGADDGWEEWPRE